MKVFIFLLILAAFLQSSVMPVNLVLLLLIARSLVVSGKENLIAAFLGGVLIGFLQAENLGFWCLVLLLVVKLVSTSRKLPVSKNIFTVAFISTLAIVLVNFLHQLIFKQTLDQWVVISEIILSLPIYACMLFWEERFVVKGEERLKLRNR
jgi:cell shape-determining protein MreD